MIQEKEILIAPQKKWLKTWNLIEYINKHLIKLFEQGIEQELKKIAVNMITKGYSDEQIAEITNLSIKRILVLRKECSV